MQQQQQGSTTQTIMTQPPRVITSKDLHYLSDHMTWQLVALKKCYHYAKECMDQDAINLLNQAGQMHLRHYQMLLKHCQQNNMQM